MSYKQVYDERTGNTSIEFVQGIYIKITILLNVIYIDLFRTAK